MITVIVALGLALALAIVVMVTGLFAWRRRRDVLLMQEADILRRLTALEHDRARRDIARMDHIQGPRVSRPSSRAEVNDDIFDRLGLAEPAPIVEAPPPTEEDVGQRRETLRFPTATVYQRLLQDDDD